MSHLIEQIEQKNKERITEMDKISGEIKKYEALFKKWNFDETIVITTENFKLFWCHISKRLECKEGHGASRPLIEMPFRVREFIVKKGLIDELLKEVIKHLESRQ